MYTDRELEKVLHKAIGNHQSLDHKLHLIQLVSELVEKAERYEKALKEISELDLYNTVNVARARAIAKEVLLSHSDQRTPIKRRK